jgi:hypothetical protein
MPLRTDALATHLIQGSTMTAYCNSEMAGNVVYISKMFDIASPARAGGGIDTSREALHQQDAGDLQCLSRRVQTGKRAMHFLSVDSKIEKVAT